MQGAGYSGKRIAKEQNEALGNWDRSKDRKTHTHNGGGAGGGMKQALRNRSQPARTGTRGVFPARAKTGRIMQEQTGSEPALGCAALDQWLSHSELSCVLGCDGRWFVIYLPHGDALKQT